MSSVQAKQKPPQRRTTEHRGGDHPRRIQQSLVPPWLGKSVPTRGHGVPADPHDRQLCFAE
nr:MAG TPA: hypothetical protein [Caudoviricetes sp.]